MTYMLTNILGRTDKPLSYIYDFAWTRFRAIDKDYRVQRVVNEVTVKIYEQVRPILLSWFLYCGFSFLLSLTHSTLSF